MPSAPRIDKLEKGTFVTLDFNDRYQEDAVFLGIVGEGDDRRARFAQAGASHAASANGCYRMTEWEAYRYNGGWAFGTSAERLRLVGVMR